MIDKLKQVSIRLIEQPPLYSKEPMNNPKAAIRVMSGFLKKMDRELFCVVNLRTDMKPINMNVVSMGSINESVVHPREVMKSAILSNAANMMFIHNHPSGNLYPSKADISVTDRLQQAGALMGIGIVDHIIVGKDEEYFSFHENRICTLPELKYTTEIETLGRLGEYIAEDQICRNRKLGGEGKSVGEWFGDSTDPVSQLLQETKDIYNRRYVKNQYETEL